VENKGWVRKPSRGSTWPACTCRRF
jgi:hypothetical protein